MLMTEKTPLMIPKDSPDTRRRKSISSNSAEVTNGYAKHHNELWTHLTSAGEFPSIFHVTPALPGGEKTDLPSGDAWRIQCIAGLRPMRSGAGRGWDQQGEEDAS